MIFNELGNKIVLLKKIGLSASTALELFCRQVVAPGDLPIEPQVANEKTMKAIRAFRAGKGRSFSTAEELFKDLGI